MFAARCDGISGVYRRKAVHVDDLAVRVLDCGIVVLDEHVLHKADGHGRFTHAASAHHDHLRVLRELRENKKTE